MKVAPGITLIFIGGLIVGNLCQSFDKNYVGVAFSPYVKQWQNGAIPYYNSYSLDDIKIMLRIVAKKFSSISTYGMGVAPYNKGAAWDKLDSNCLVAKAAAQVNKESGQKVISMNQGVYQVANDLRQQEIEAAFSATADANSLFGGTVWGITFTNEYITADNPNSGNEVLQMIRVNKGRANQRGLKVGTRVQICGEIYGGQFQSILQQLARESDYIMCNVYPAKKDVDSGIPYAVKAVGDYFLYLRQGFKAVNPNLEVLIGETGWPDQGKSFNDSPNTIGNLKDYWVGMGQWASTNRVRVQMFEAFDEPWKSDQNNGDPNNIGGRYGAEGHYGWWKRTNNNDANAYVDKVTGRNA